MKKPLRSSLMLTIAALLASCGDKQPAPAAPPPVQKNTESIPGARKVDAVAVESALKEIQSEYRWKGSLAKPTDEFLNAVGPKFTAWQELLTKLSAAGQRQEADQICAAIVALRNHWGKEIFPPEVVDAFGRDRFLVRDLRVDVAQFFEPVPYSPNDSLIMKLYRFSVYKADKVIARYYLEHSKLDGNPHYVLGLSEGAAHTQVQPYGANPPTYWQLKERVRQHLASPPAGEPQKK